MDFSVNLSTFQIARFIPKMLFMSDLLKMVLSGFGRKVLLAFAVEICVFWFVDGK